MKFIGIIPARSGSVRVPFKNIKPLAGKPLIYWTIKAALGSMLERVIVSTDSRRIAQMSRRYGAEVPFTRPKEISADVDTGLVLRHAAGCLKKAGYRPDWFALLQPTSPMRTAQDINNCILLCDDPNHGDGCDSVVSVYPASQYPQWMFVEQEGYLKRYMDLDLSELRGDVLISQNLPKLLYPNGAVYMVPRRLAEKGIIFGNRIRPYIMERERSLDLEEEWDFEVAESRMAGQEAV